MKKLLSLLLLLSIPTFLWASTMTPQQKQQVVNSINNTVERLQTMSCSFVQTKHMSMLNDEMTSRGKMYYKRANKFRCEYSSPYTYLFVFNGSKVYVGNKGQKSIIDTDSNKVFREIARLMMSTITGNALSNAKDFAIDIYDCGSNWGVTLMPKKKTIKRMFKKIDLFFNKSDFIISQINIYEYNNDKTTIHISNVQNNITINETLFAIP